MDVVVDTTKASSGVSVSVLEYLQPGLSFQVEVT